MKKLLGLLVISGLMVVGCSKTVPTGPNTGKDYKIYFGQDAAAQGFVVPTQTQAKAYADHINKIYEQKTQRKSVDVDFTCDDIFSFLGGLGVNIPDQVRELQCQGKLHMQRFDTGLLDWDVFVAVLAGYGKGAQGMIGGAGGLDFAASLRSVDSIQASLGFMVDYFIDSLAYAYAGSFGNHVAVAAGGVGFIDFPPQEHTITVIGANDIDHHTVGVSWTFDSDITISLPAN